LSADPGRRLEAEPLARHLGRLGGPHAAGVAALVGAVASAGTRIADALARAALDGRTGGAGIVNVQGEAVKKLDVWANDAMRDALAATGAACLLVSEEMEAPLELDGAGGYVVCFDPVDGSSNLDINGVVGTIFSIRARSGGGPRRDAVLAGTAQVAAGYVMYGPATQLVLTAGAGVHVFTLDRARGAFVLTQPGVRIPARGRTYSINEGNTAHWGPEVARFVRHLKESDVASGRPYTARYAGSLVADFHRMLLEGGVFLYPADAAGQGKLTSGKLRLQYEAAPIALVAEAAGGRASTGTRRILEIEPASPHARVPLIVGSPEDVALAEDFYAQRR